ncbi:MAG: hypothetical protein MMC33_007027 [Icmadophila ericetorum]|nr:hypothetical protein [Icmadophila ericetorum]
MPDIAMPPTQGVTCTQYLLEKTRGWEASPHIDDGVRQEAAALTRVLEHFQAFGAARLLSPQASPLPAEPQSPHGHYSQSTIQIINNSIHHPFSIAALQNNTPQPAAPLRVPPAVLEGTLLDSRYAPRRVDRAIAESEFAKIAAAKGISIRREYDARPLVSKGSNGPGATEASLAYVHAEHSTTRSAEDPRTIARGSTEESPQTNDVAAQFRGLSDQAAKLDGNFQPRASYEEPPMQLSPSAKEFSFTGTTTIIVNRALPSVQTQTVNQQLDPIGGTRTTGYSSSSVEGHIAAERLGTALESQTRPLTITETQLSLLPQLEHPADKATENQRIAMSPMLSPILATVETSENSTTFSEPLIAIKTEGDDVAGINLSTPAYTSGLNATLPQSPEAQENVLSVIGVNDVTDKEQSLVVSPGQVNDCVNDISGDLVIHKQLSNNHTTIFNRDRFTEDMLKLQASDKEISKKLATQANAKENAVPSSVRNEPSQHAVSGSGAGVSDECAQLNTQQSPSEDVYRCSILGRVPKRSFRRSAKQLAAMTNTIWIPPAGASNLGKLLSPDERMAIVLPATANEAPLSEAIKQFFRLRRQYTLKHFAVELKVRSAGILKVGCLHDEAFSCADLGLKLLYNWDHVPIIQIVGTIRDTGPKSTLHLLRDGQPLLGRTYILAIKLPSCIHPDRSEFKTFTVAEKDNLPNYIKTMIDDADLPVTHLRYMSFSLKQVMHHGFSNGACPDWNEVAESDFSIPAQIFYAFMMSIRDGGSMAGYGNLKIWFLHPAKAVDRFLNAMNTAHLHETQTFKDRGLTWCSRLVDGRVVWRL